MTIKGLDEAFIRVIAQYTAGSPMDEQIKWTNLTRVEIAQLLKEVCHNGITLLNHKEHNSGAYLILIP